MRLLILILCTGFLSACGSAASVSASNEWTNMDYAAVGGAGAGGNYLSISQAWA